MTFQTKRNHRTYWTQAHITDRCGRGREPRRPRGAAGARARAATTARGCGGAAGARGPGRARGPRGHAGLVMGCPENRGMTWIELDGAVNVRDVGGLPLTDGGVTAEGRLLRADNLQALSAADVARLVDGIGLTTVVDLRSTAELTAEGPAPLDAVASVRHAHHPVLPEEGLATDVVADVFVVRDEQDRSRYPGDRLTGHYLGYLEDRPEQVVAAVRSIATSDGAALVHCAAGKDRTGVVVALAL